MKFLAALAALFLAAPLHALVTYDLSGIVTQAQPSLLGQPYTGHLTLDETVGIAPLDGETEPADFVVLDSALKAYDFTVGPVNFASHHANSEVIDGNNAYFSWIPSPIGDADLYFRGRPTNLSPQIIQTLDLFPEKYFVFEGPSGNFHGTILSVVKANAQLLLSRRIAQEPEPLPEPGSLALFGLPAAGLLAMRKRLVNL